MTGPRIPPETRATILRLAGTLHLSGIAREMNIRISTADAILRKAGVRPAIKFTTPVISPKCSAGCDSPAVAFGKCSRCYQRQRREEPKEREPEPGLPPGKPDPREAAEEALIHAYRLNNRKAVLEIDALGFKLHGRRVGFNEVMREANDHRRRWGQAMLDANPAWLPKDSG